MRVPQKALLPASLLFLLFCGLKLTHQLQDYLDVGMHDESIYLQSGVAFFKTVPKAESGPL